MSDTEKQMTPLSELIQKLEGLAEFNRKNEQLASAYNMAALAAKSLLPKEKQGIIEAYSIGSLTDLTEENPRTGEQYFTEKYTQ